jgi:hypothetical protein
LVIVLPLIGNISFVFRHQIKEAYTKYGDRASHIVHFGNKCRHLVIFSLLQLKFQEHNPLESLKIFIFRAARQVNIYIPIAALILDTITYIRVVKLLYVWTFFGHIQGGMQQRNIK